MCGIAAVLHPNGAKALVAVRRMNDAQRHRGPDDSGEYVTTEGGRTLALGHRRLSIQDVTRAGHQPMTNPATGDVIVYNGEIYNVVELRAELTSLGAQFRSRSDTEVILHSFAQWGSACADRLNGMFAFALWSPRGRTLHIARDRLGIKPLYFAEVGDAFALGSEVRAILASGLTDGTIDRRAVASLFAYGAVAAPLTTVEGIRLVDPGTWSELSIGDDVVRRTHVFWRMPEKARRESSASLVGAELREHLERAVASHMISDVPVGIFLSSGIDSTAVAALAGQARRGDIDTFCVSLAEDKALDESHMAARTAQSIGSRHHEVHVGESKALSLARSWLASTDQPGVDGLNTFIISRAVRECGIVVALSGVGGDEMFGGYSTFREVPVFHALLRTARTVPSGLRRRTAIRLAACLGEQRASKLGDLVASDGNIRDLYFLRRRLFSDQDMVRFGFDRPSWRAARYLPAEAMDGLNLPANDHWAAVRALETRFYLGNTLLRDTDVFGMAHGLEIRVPLLDARVVDCALSYSRKSPIWRSPSKSWVIEALGRRLPEHVRSLPKRGFSVPQGRWLRGPLYEEFTSHVESLAQSGAVDGHAVRLAWKQCVSEQDSGAGGWSRAWLLATLGAWVNRLGASRTAAAAFRTA